MRLHVLLLVGLVLCAVPAHAGPGGTVKGRVLVVKDAKVVKGARAWVYLEATRKPRRRPRPAVPPPPREIRQVKETFVPDVLVVPLGTEVWFPNDDTKEHNVFSPTDPPGPFDLGRYNRDKKGRPHLFQDAAEIEIYCDVHQAMSARVKVVDSQFIAEVVNGEFTFTGVPPGTYVVHAWTPNSRESSDKVVVTDGGVATPDDLRVNLSTERPHVRRDGSRYPIYPK